MITHFTKWLPLATLSDISTNVEPARKLSVQRGYLKWLSGGGRALPAINLFLVGRSLGLQDGNHRLAVAREFGFPVIKATIANQDGSPEPAGWPVHCPLCNNVADERPHRCIPRGSELRPAYMLEHVRSAVQVPSEDLPDIEIVRQIQEAIATRIWARAALLALTLHHRVADKIPTQELKA